MRLVVVASLAFVLAGCVASPASQPAPNPSPPSAEPLVPESGERRGSPQDWLVRRTFAFELRSGLNAPFAYHSSYDGLAGACTLFTLPSGMSRLTLWLNSTPDDPVAARVGGVTFDLRQNTGSPPTLVWRPENPAPRSHVLIVDDPPNGQYQAAFKAEEVTWNGHAEGVYILEGSGVYEEDALPDPMAACR